MYYLLIPEVREHRYYERDGANTDYINKAKHFDDYDLRAMDRYINQGKWGVIRIEDDGSKTIIREGLDDIF